MNEVERLLRQDRNAGVPEPPDLRYTVAAVQRRLGQQPSGSPAPQRSLDWLMALAGVALLIGLATLVPFYGLSPWWLLLPAVTALPLWPVLMQARSEKTP